MKFSFMPLRDLLGTWFSAGLGSAGFDDLRQLFQLKQFSVPSFLAWRAVVFTYKTLAEHCINP